MTNNNQELVKDILKLLELSSMENDEKQMWTLMAPSMNTEELTNFKKILEKEVNQLTDLLLSALNSPKQK